MVVYLDLVILLNFLVDFLLLLGTNRLSGFPQSPQRCVRAALVGGFYGGACLLPGFRFLGSTLWRLVSLGCMGVIAFGIGKSALRRSILFVLLSMALGGIALGLGSGSFTALILSAGAVCLLCAVGFRGSVGSREYVRVELCYDGKHTKILALRDTGNTLRDPITGQGVIVVSAEVAAALVGLTKQQLSAPVETVASGIVPGLRLIPYRAVGQECGMLAALRLQEVRIGKWQGSSMVAFAPTGLDSEGTYQALTGGIA